MIKPTLKSIYSLFTKCYQVPDQRDVAEIFWHINTRTANVFLIRITAQEITGFLQQGSPVRITEKPNAFCGDTL